MQNDMRDRLIELINQDNCPSPYICDERCKYSHLEQCIGDRLADHLIANGVILPPCKVGDTVYFIPKYITDWIHDDVEYIKITKDGFVIKTVADWYFDEEDFGKTVFLTKEQAEQKLKEMRADNDKIY